MSVRFTMYVQYIYIYMFYIVSLFISLSIYFYTEILYHSSIDANHINIKYIVLEKDKIVLCLMLNKNECFFICKEKRCIQQEQKVLGSVRNSPPKENMTQDLDHDEIGFPKSIFSLLYSTFNWKRENGDFSSSILKLCGSFW